LAMELVADHVYNIQRMPAGVPPQVYVWCHHARSGKVVFPDHGGGIATILSVFLPSEGFGYIGSADAPVKTVVLSRNVSFPAFRPRWAMQKFPAYYYDEVTYTIIPTLPAGLKLSDQTGHIQADPLPQQLSGNPVQYTIRAQSRYDVREWREAQLTLSVQEPAKCLLRGVKSTEALVACSIQDANNLYLQALYFVISTYGSAPPLQRSSFSCYPGAVQRNYRGSVLEGDCTKTSYGCCCWVWVPGGSDLTSRSLLGTIVVSRITTLGCGLEEQSRYTGISMAAGVNPLAANEQLAVVSKSQFEFTVPRRDDAKPIQFEMKVDINYDEECDPVRNGPDAEAKCREKMKKELQALLGAPEGMIEVYQVRPG